MVPSRGPQGSPQSGSQSRLRSEHLTQAGAPFPVSTWMKDQPGREKKEEVCAFAYGQSSVSHCPPMACLPLSSRRQAKPISLLSASGKREASQTPSLKRKWRRIQARTCSLGSELKSVHCVHRKLNQSLGTKAQDNVCSPALTSRNRGQWAFLWAPIMGIVGVEGRGWGSEVRDPGSHLVRPGRSRPGSGRSLRQLPALNHLGVQGCLQPSTSQRELLTSLPSAVLTVSTAAALSSLFRPEPLEAPSTSLCVSLLLCNPSGSPEGWDEVTSGLLHPPLTWVP